MQFGGPSLLKKITKLQKEVQGLKKGQLGGDPEAGLCQLSGEVTSFLQQVRGVLAWSGCSQSTCCQHWAEAVEPEARREAQLANAPPQASKAGPAGPWPAAFFPATVNVPLLGAPVQRPASSWLLLSL